MSDSNAKRIAARLAWDNLPPGMRPGEEALPDPAWMNASAREVYERMEPEALDHAMRESIADDAYEKLDDAQIEELATGGYYSPTHVELDHDSAKLHFEREKPTDIPGAPELFSVTLRNPFVS